MVDSIDLNRTRKRKTEKLIRPKKEEEEVVVLVEVGEEEKKRKTLAENPRKKSQLKKN